MKATSWVALGCQARLVVTDDGALPAAAKLLAKDLAALDLACSRFRDDSELMTICRYPGQILPISQLLTTAIAAGLRAARETDGAVDPMLGASLTALGYDRDFDRMNSNPMNSDPINSATGAVRVVRPEPALWQRIELDVAARTVCIPTSGRTSKGARLDLGATAKALGADLAAQHIHQELGCGVLVSLGGDVAVAGPAPMSGWAIRVQNVTGEPDEVADGPTHVIAISRGGLATSSPSARRWVRGGRVYHHILDPRSGVPVVSTWRTVTVAADTCLDANIATTAAMVRGADAVAWLTRLGLPARLISENGRVTALAGWPAESGVAA